MPISSDSSTSIDELSAAHHQLPVTSTRASATAASKREVQSGRESFRFAPVRRILRDTDRASLASVVAQIAGIQCYLSKDWMREHACRRHPLQVERAYRLRTVESESELMAVADEAHCLELIDLDVAGVGTDLKRATGVLWRSELSQEAGRRLRDQPGTSGQSAEQ